MATKFWMVYAEGGNSPIKQHVHREDAEAEAQRICQKNKRPVFVLESVCGYKVPEPEIASFLTDEEVPYSV